MSSQATVEPSEDRKVTLISCRRCSSKFQYELRSGEKATIIIGIPPSGVEYKAISFVWGDVHPLPVDCLGCGETSHILVSDASKLRRLMELVGPQMHGLTSCPLIKTMSKIRLPRLLQWGISIARHLVSPCCFRPRMPWHIIHCGFYI
jgi:hypothetical protein